jgi:phage terminase large subunit-like protein
MGGTNLLAEISREFVSGTSEITDIVTFVESSWGLGIKLLPVQKFILKALYGLPLSKGEKTIDVPDIVNEHILYKFNEDEFLKWLYAEKRCNVEVTEGKIFQELILAIGRRGTKSTLASCISNYEMYKLLKRGDPSAFYGFPPFTVFSILNVAPTDEQSGIVFDMTQNMAMRCPYMKDRSNHQTMTYFDLQTDPDIKAHGKARSSLISLAGGCSSNALRGRNAIIVIMDEMAHFIDNNGRFSGSEVYKALTPSIASFRRDGKVILISSPYAKFGRFYDRFTESFTEPEITLSFKMYSAMVNPTIPTEILKAARKRDRVGFMCEYGGEFSDTITAWIDDENEFKRCVVNTPAPGRGVHDVQYYYGIDLGFKNDGTSVSIVHKENDKIVLDYANVWYSGASDVWDVDDSIYKMCNKYAGLELIRMNDIVGEIKELVKWFPAKEGVFDQHNGYALAELFQTEHLPQFAMESFSEGLNSEVYQLTKRLYAEQLLTLFDHPVLVKELLTLEAEKRARDKTIVRAPGRKGAHDDISDAFCRAVWKCYNGYRERPSNLSTGSGGSLLPSQGGGKIETQASFIVKKLRQHGNHPRGLYNISSRRSMTMGR